jgi:hypothetical protein
MGQSVIYDMPSFVGGPWRSVHRKSKDIQYYGAFDFQSHFKAPPTYHELNNDFYVLTQHGQGKSLANEMRAHVRMPISRAFYLIRAYAGLRPFFESTQRVVIALVFRQNFSPLDTKPASSRSQLYSGESIWNDSCTGPGST